jgi:hypothetical protein
LSKGCYKNEGGGGTMGKGKGDGVGAKHVFASTFIPDPFISFGMFNIFCYVKDVKSTTLNQ